MKYASILLSGIGLILICVSVQMPTYTTSEASYRAAYDSIDSASPTADSQFTELRKHSLTKKFIVEDYGIVALGIGLIGAVLFRRKDKELRAPTSKSRIVVLGLLCVATSTTALLASMFIGLNRGDYPHWADSAGIGIAQCTAVGLFLLIFMAPHLLFLRGGFLAGQKIKFVSSIATWWLLLLSLFFGCGFLMSTAQGDILAPAFALWAYFFASLMAGKTAARKHEFSRQV